MSESISRRVYRQLLSLYPKPFRREFGDDMASIFEECSSTQATWRLLLDVLLSAAKQQIYCVATPRPKGALLFSATGSSSNLPRLLSAAVFCAELTAGVLAGRPTAPQSAPAIRSEILFWFPAPGWARYCSAATALTEKAKSAMLADVWVARDFEAPEAWRIIRIACGPNRSAMPPSFAKSGFATALAARESILKGHLEHTE